MKPQDLVRPEILALKAYPVAPAEGMVKLDAMENPYSLPESVRRELAEALSKVDLNRYPDPAAPKLRALIARKMGVSRQTAQRLVSLAMSERLIRVQLDHPITQCMEIAQTLVERYGLRQCEVVPSDPGSASTVLGIDQATVTPSRGCSGPTYRLFAISKSCPVALLNRRSAWSELTNVLLYSKTPLLSRGPLVA